MELVRNRQRRKHSELLRIHCRRRIDDRAHLFIHVGSQLLDIRFVQLTPDGIHLPKDLNLYRPAHGRVPRRTCVKIAHSEEHGMSRRQDCLDERTPASEEAARGSWWREVSVARGNAPGVFSSE